MKLKTGQKCAFGFGAFGKDIVYMLISSYLLYYYNVVLGMSSVFIGTVMMAARIFDAFNDPVMGIKFILLCHLCKILSVLSAHKSHPLDDPSFILTFLL